MRPVDQSIVDSRRGDCWSACLASILELPLEAVPKFVWHFPHNSDLATQHWLEQFGYTFMRLRRFIKSDDERYFWNATGFDLWFCRDMHCILTGRSPNIPGCFHAVVGRIGYHGEIEVVHDPNPSRKGILGAPHYLSLLIQIDPTRHVLRHEAEKPKYREATLEEMN